MSMLAKVSLRENSLVFFGSELLVLQQQAESSRMSKGLSIITTVRARITALLAEATLQPAGLLGTDRQRPRLFNLIPAGVAEKS